MTKQELIKQCERQISLNTRLPLSGSRKLIIYHKIFLELLRGRDVNEMFNENGEYNERNNQLCRKAAQ